jgi:hypothetical protein
VLFVRCGKELKLSSDGGDCSKRSANKAMVRPAVGESLQSGGLFCVGAFGRNLKCSHCEDVIIYTVVCKDVLYMFCLQCDFQR